MLLLTLMTILALTASAHDFVVNGIYYNKNGNEATVTYRGTSYSQYSDEYSGNVVIPSTVKYNGTTYSVTSIGNYAFAGCKGLTSVTIRYSVTSIGNQAFEGCSGLTSVTIPNSVTSIGGGAFSGCSGLTSVTIPNSVTSIGSGAFSGCSGLTSVDIPNSITEIGNYAFEYCSGLTSVTIPNSVTSIGDDAFWNCSGLTSIVVDSENTKYDSRDNSNAIIETATNTLIAGCKNTTIPNSVTSIGDDAFYNCGGLTSVTIPNSVTYIGWAAFSGCSGLTEIRSKIVNVRNVSMGTSVFYNVPKSSCTLKVPIGTATAYRNANQWKDFSNINEVILMPNSTVGDLNRDNAVNGEDINIMVNYLLHKSVYIDDDGVADIDGDGKPTGFDLNRIVRIILGE